MKNIIFDLGAVLFAWNPEAIAVTFTTDTDLQNRILTDLFYHPDWIDFDHGIISEKNAIRRASERLLLSKDRTTDLFEATKASLILIPEMLKVLTKAKKKQLNLYCLSNISSEFFEYLSTRHSFFELFDGIVTSGIENVGKPDKKIFEILLNRYKIKAMETLFIDDNKANTSAATEMGIKSITFKASPVCYEKINFILNL